DWRHAGARGRDRRAAVAQHEVRADGRGGNARRAASRALERAGRGGAPDANRHCTDRLVRVLLLDLGDRVAVRAVWLLGTDDAPLSRKLRAWPALRSGVRR